MHKIAPSLIATLTIAFCTSVYGQQDSFSDSKAIDLTHKLSPKIPVFPGGVGFTLEPLTKTTDRYFLNQLKTGEHIGTHVDAPIHFDRKGHDVSALSLDLLIGDLVVIDVREQCNRDADYAVTIADVEAWESKNGKISENSIVAIWTGWQEKWADPKAYCNVDANGTPHFPGVGEDAAMMLVRKREISGLCIDTLSVDRGKDADFPVHKFVLSQGRFHVENIANLQHVPASGCKIGVFPLPIEGGSGAPARVVAFPQQKNR